MRTKINISKDDLLTFAREHGACSGGLEYIRGHKSPLAEEIYDTCTNTGHINWLAERLALNLHAYNNVTYEQSQERQRMHEFVRKANRTAANAAEKADPEYGEEWNKTYAKVYRKLLPFQRLARFAIGVEVP